MSILGYSAAYFLPQYWVNTPLYGEKIIPLLDYILSTDYVHTDKLATAFYDIESKYKNTADLPMSKIEAIIEESGYGYIRKLLGDDKESIKLLVYLLVMIHQLKGSKKGIEIVLSLLKASGNEMELSFMGNPNVTAMGEVSDFTDSDYVVYSNFSVGTDPFEINFQIKTGDSFGAEQCIASASEYGFYLVINTAGQRVLSIGQQIGGIRGWQEIDGRTRFVSTKALERNTNYYITLAFSGNTYTIQVSEDGNNYSYYLLLNSSVPIDVNGGNLTLGIDNSTSVTRYPFGGVISLAPFAVASKNIKVTQWFEVFPVDEEDTFMVDAEVDVSLIGSDFFVNFANFVKKYVYPTLKVFRARLALKNKITFLPYVRQRVTYVASNISDNTENFQVVEEDNRDNHIPYEVEDGYNSHEDFLVQSPSEA